jgi:hypothetical protein
MTRCAMTGSSTPTRSPTRGLNVGHTNYADAIHGFANMVDLEGSPSLGEYSEQILDDAAGAIRAHFE